MREQRENTPGVALVVEDRAFDIKGHTGQYKIIGNTLTVYGAVYDMSEDGTYGELRVPLDKLEDLIEEMKVIVRNIKKTKRGEEVWL